MGRTDDNGPAPRILAVASGGGHWEQLMRLRPAFERTETFYASTNKGYADRESIRDLAVIPDANRHSARSASFRTLTESWKLVRRLRPDVVVSTGAMPGLFCIAFGRLFGARTMWIDSIANSERMSVSGRFARFLAHETLTQWPHLANGRSPVFRGSVL